MDDITIRNIASLPGPERIRMMFWPAHKVGLSQASKVINLSVSRMSRRRRAGTLSLKISQDEYGKFFVLVDDLVDYLYPSLGQAASPVPLPAPKRGRGRPRKEGGGR
jgi:hypothetical protein